MKRPSSTELNDAEAAFALLMHAVAVLEGKRLLQENERLKSDPAAAVPPEIDQKCTETIKKAFEM